MHYMPCKTCDGIAADGKSGFTTCGPEIDFPSSSSSNLIPTPLGWPRFPLVHATNLWLTGRRAGLTGRQFSGPSSSTEMWRGILLAGDQPTNRRLAIGSARRIGAKALPARPCHSLSWRARYGRSFAGRKTESCLDSGFAEVRIHDARRGHVYRRGGKNGRRVHPGNWDRAPGSVGQTITAAFLH